MSVLPGCPPGTCVLISPSCTPEPHHGEQLSSASESPSSLAHWLHFSSQQRTCLPDGWNPLPQKIACVLGWDGCNIKTWSCYTSIGGDDDGDHLLKGEVPVLETEQEASLGWWPWAGVPKQPCCGRSPTPWVNLWLIKSHRHHIWIILWDRISSWMTRFTRD